ncbi:tRNA (guanine(37)-N1)-methyltransferase [Cytospora mali]|uniref:tRNA (guanine(37)-N1)-methyltransferase n=1 Tax=Cytospora mali TaxID=578113 RepID=A0A194UQW9_CYTMA|nr:tRNA (guanine(37)-N1)-methyltransferase [Valsa mali var. pyri (nom. inval.)]
MTTSGSHSDGADKQQEDIMSLMRPPRLQPSTTLNKALFSKTVNLAAASVRDNKKLSNLRQALAKSGDILPLDRISAIIPDPDADLAAKGRKCLLLNPSILPKQPETWGPVISELVKKEEVGIVPYELKLEYDYWTYRDVLSTLMPEELHEDIPSGFNTAGHVAHLNLREQHLPYKQLIGQVLVEKNQHIRTVINKTDNVGTESEFRTFGYEVLAGEDDLNVELNENACIFKFDYSKVYWNSKLEKEHTRLVRLFQPGDVVCDVMAGIGPFAVPAGKRGVFVWANDYNPESYKYLQDAINRNKVSPYVRPFNEDGRTFICNAADSVLAASKAGEAAVVPSKQKFSRSNPDAPRPPPTVTPIPPTISHFVMNLPASAIEFLPSYRGVYAGQESLFAPHTETKLPMVHVHCFALKSDDDVPRLDVCERVSKYLGATMRWDGKMVSSCSDVEAGQVAVHHVRDVAPAKSMYCASFRLPSEVAFAARG